jgi:carbon-monoxide dehydrogenase large subunit
VEITVEGRVRVTAGSIGEERDHEATCAVVGDVLGIPAGRVDLVECDPGPAAAGPGGAGRPSEAIRAHAVEFACLVLLRKARLVAAQLFHASPDDIGLGNDGLAVVGYPGGAIPWATLAEAALDEDLLSYGLRPGLDGVCTIAACGAGTARGRCLVAAVELDCDTGQVLLLRMIAVDDQGAISYPTLADGQIHLGRLAELAPVLLAAVGHDDVGSAASVGRADDGFAAHADLPVSGIDGAFTVTADRAAGRWSGAASDALEDAVVDALVHLGVGDVAKAPMSSGPCRTLQRVRPADLPTPGFAL